MQERGKQVLVHAQSSSLLRIVLVLTLALEEVPSEARNLRLSSRRWMKDHEPSRRKIGSRSISISTRSTIPKDHLDYTAHQLLERARHLGFGALAITLHDKVFDRAEVFADAAAMGILLIPAAEMRLEGADVVLLNVQPDEVEEICVPLPTCASCARAAATLFFALRRIPFFFFGGSIGKRLLQEIDCFDAIEICHFHKGWFDLNRRARKVAAAYGKPLLATSDAHRLRAFGSHYTSVPRPRPTDDRRRSCELSARGPHRLTSPPRAGAICSASSISFSSTIRCANDSGCGRPPHAAQVEAGLVSSGSECGRATERLSPS